MSSFVKLFKIQKEVKGNPFEIFSFESKFKIKQNI